MAARGEGRPRAAKKARLTAEAAQREAELEGLLFGRDEEALQQLGQEVGGGGGGGAPPAGASLTDFLRSYAARRDGSDDDEGEGGGARGAGRAGDDLLLFEDRQGRRAAGSDGESGSGSGSDDERGGSGSEDDDEGAPGAARGQQQQQQARARRRPVWEDPADATVRVNVAAAPRLRKLRREEGETKLTGRQYEARLREQHNRLHPRAAWASLKGAAARRAGADGDADGADAERLLHTAGGLLARGAALPPTLLETTKLRDANQGDPCKGAAKSVDWHADGRLLLAAGLDRRVRLFAVDGVKNPRAASWFLEDMPVHRAVFAAGGAKVLAAGRRPFLYLLDVESGATERLASLRAWRAERSFESFATSQAGGPPLAAFLGNEGCVPLLDLHTKQVAGTLKMNGTARSGAFSADGAQLLTSGGDGTVYVWDLRTQRCLQRYADEGCLNGTALACSPDGALFASGSSSGVVNVYARQALGAAGSAAVAAAPRRTMFGAGGGWALPEAPVAGKPLRSVLNLTTGVDSLGFSHDGQMLVMASRLKRDALRVLHVPTLTVFSNWPTSKSPLHYVHAAAFSPHSGYLAIGNARGRVLLYRLHHYAQA